MRMMQALGVVALAWLCGCAEGVDADGVAGPAADACSPGAVSCDGDTVVACLPDGSGTVERPCDSALGLRCDAGACVGACSPESLGDSYVGCEYYPTVTGNEVAEHFEFAVAVSNTSMSYATVTIDGGALTEPVQVAVSPGALHIERLPWVAELKGCMEALISPFTTRCETDSPGALSRGGAYRLRSDVPVTVYQFNPLDYYTHEPFGLHSYTNDASLLLPVNTWRGEYITASFHSWSSGYDEPGLMAVTAQADNTAVTITSTAPTRAMEGDLRFDPGVPTTTVLDRGDVLQLMTYDGDFTGTTVSADSPVQLIAGHYCTRVPFDVAACDHLEESMFPTETLGNDYLLTAPNVPSSSGDTPKHRVIRVIAVEDDTRFSFDPPIGELPALAAGQFYESALLTDDYRLTSNRRVLVAQYMAGMEAGGETGDPAMALAVTAQQFRSDYIFVAPVTYESNFVNVVAPVGAAISIDGVAVDAWTVIGSSGFAVARVPLSDDDGGTHHASGDEPFGISVYGYGEYTSYWYPGGLDLAKLEIEPPK